MLTDNIYFQEERKFAIDRFVVLVVFTLLAFVLSGQSNKEIAEKMLLVGFVLLIVDIVSALHYYFMSIYPDRAIAVRKMFLVLTDIGVLTYFMYLFEHWGLFLLPFYILVVMRAGLSFGVSYFYGALASAGIAWIALLTYSPYWREHSDIIASFAITTFLIPLFYLKYIIRIHQENHELSETLNDVVYDATYDELTGVANRKQYKETIQKLIQEETPFSLLFIDLNKFKAINDNHGHHIGDEVLKEVARRLSEHLDEDDFIARLGGDEFVIITKRKKVYMDKFLAKLERFVIGRHKIGKIVVPIELSIGVSFFPEDAKTAMMLGKYADMAMYAAKKDEERYHYYYHELSDAQKEEFANQ